MPRTVAISKYFKLVKKNKGAPCKLKSGEYKPSPVKRTYIDKDDGTKRPLGIPTFKDRVVQQVVRNIIEPIFEKTFHPSSYGYRPNQLFTRALALISLKLASISHGFSHISLQLVA